MRQYEERMMTDCRAWRGSPPSHWAEAAQLFQLTGASPRRWSGWHPQWAGPRHSARSPWSPGRPGAPRQLRCWRLWPWHCSQNTPVRKDLDTLSSFKAPGLKWLVPMAVTTVSPSRPVRICYLPSTSSTSWEGCGRLGGECDLLPGADMANHSNARKHCTNGTQKMSKRDVQEAGRSFITCGVYGRLYLPTHPKQVPNTSPPVLFLPSSICSPSQSFTEHLITCQEFMFPGRTVEG